MKSGRAKIAIFQKMRIKNLMGSVRSDLKKLDSFTLKTSKNHLIRSFLRNGRVWVKLPPNWVTLARSRVFNLVRRLISRQAKFAE